VFFQNTRGVDHTHIPYTHNTQTHIFSFTTHDRYAMPTPTPGRVPLVYSWQQSARCAGRQKMAVPGPDTDIYSRSRPKWRARDVEMCWTKMLAMRHMYPSSTVHPYWCNQVELVTPPHSLSLLVSGRLMFLKHCRLLNPQENAGMKLPRTKFPFFVIKHRADGQSARVPKQPFTCAHVL